MKLTVVEIENITRLLLDKEEQNQEIALVLIQNNPTVVPQVQVAINEALQEKKVDKSNPFFVFQKIDNNNYNYYVDRALTNKMLNLGRDYGALIFSNSKYENYYSFLAEKIINNNPAKAVVAFRTLTQNIPAQKEYFLNLATALILKKEPAKNAAEIIAAYLQSYELHPSPETLCKLGAFYVEELKNIAQAEIYLEKAINEFPYDLEAYLAHANLLFQRKDYEEAKEKIEYVLQQFDNEIPRLFQGEVYYLLGLIYWQYLGEIEAATSYLDKSMVYMNEAKQYEAFIQMYKEQKDKEKVEYWSDLFNKWRFY